MIKFSGVTAFTRQINNTGDEKDTEAIEKFIIPEDVEVYEITGPLFFGAAYKFKEAMRFIERPPKILILRMRHVPIIDATGIRTLEDVYKNAKRNGTRLILSEVHSSQVMDELKKTRLLFAIGKANVTTSFISAIKLSNPTTH
jgi:SulP family sulfate permease